VFRLFRALPPKPSRQPTKRRPPSSRNRLGTFRGLAGVRVFPLIIHWSSKFDPGARLNRFLNQPFIRIATGDYFSDKRKRGKDNALTSILFSFAHEVIHYEQWVADRELCEKEAARGADKLLRLYRKAVARP